MTRRTLALVALATLTTGLLTACTRTEDTTFNDPGFRTARPTPVQSAPMTVPFPSRPDTPTPTAG
ncbi:MAG: hypothetical protein QOC60_1880 [Frankiaceae bacterium]|jgi:hypothetical protein|nr:hypothetical protein [Frankiaceae bacterium]